MAFNGWMAIPLSELYEFRSGLSKPRSEFGFGYGFLTFKDVLDNFFVPDTLSALVNSTDKERSTCSVRRGDVFLTRTSETQEDLGMSCVALKDYDSATFNGFTKRLRPKANTNIVPEYAAYYFRGPSFRRAVSAMSSLSTRASLNNGMLERLTIVLPPVEIQIAMGRILKALDDKIELNRRMNETLEGIARAIFKSWFVDFDPVRAKMDGRQPPGMSADIANLFPEAFEHRKGDLVPSGWDIVTVEDVAERVAMGPFGSSIKVSTFVDQGIPVISGQHLKGTLLRDHENNFITEEHADKLSKANVKRGDVIFTHAGSIGQVALIPNTSMYDRYVISQRQFYMRCNRDLVSPAYITYYFKSHEGQHRLLANTSSTGVPSISRPVTYLRSIKLIRPPRVVLDAFDSIVDNVHLKIGISERESETLAALRDTLLPKLLSGELRVKDAEQLAEVST